MGTAKATEKAKKAAPARKAVPTKKVTPAKKTAAAKKPAPTKKVAAAKKATAPVKKTVATAKKTAPAKKSAAAVKKAAPAKKAAPVKKAAAKKVATATKKATPAKKVTASKKAVPAKRAPAKKTAPRRRKVAVAATEPTRTVQNVAAAASEAPAVPSTYRWRGHAAAAHAVRAFAVSVPLAASVVSGVVMSHLVHRPHGALKILAWWAAIMAASTVVLVLVDRVARRMLPLATLLKLSMAFPDQAPSRFLVAARAGTTRSLQEQLRRAQEEGIQDEPAQAAQRILTLVGALGAHDRRTRGHSERVRAFNDLIAEELRLPQHDRDRLRWAALLHDIGKLHVPTRILNKPKKPTEKEWAVLKSHPARGARIAAPLSQWLGEWAPTIEQHHERWDGAGYPHGLSGDDICLGARIVAVADAYEVMTAPRPYSRPVSAAAAREELARCAGGQFDPEVVRAFLSISIGKLRKVIGPISWLAQLPLIGATPKLEATVGMAGRQVVSAAATATGTGVIAAAMLPQAAHLHHHHHHVEQFVTAAGSVSQIAPHSARHVPAKSTHVTVPARPATKVRHAAPVKAHAHAHAGDASGAATTSHPSTSSTGGSVVQVPHPTKSAPAPRPTTVVTPPVSQPTTPPVVPPAPKPPKTSPAPPPPKDPKPDPAPKPTPPPKDEPKPKPTPAPKEEPKPKPTPAPKDEKPKPPPPPKDDKHGDPHPEHGDDHH